MNPNCGYAGFVSWPSLFSRSLWRRLQAIAIAVLLLLTIGANPAQAMNSPASAPSTAHVYLLRGVLNIFSLGLDDIAAKLRAQGVPVTVANFASWSSLADEAAAGYRSGKLKTIILVGHSSGATALPDMAAKLDQLGVPVKLAIGLDSVFRTSLKGRVGRYINFYIANGAGTPVEKTRQFQGTLENVNVQNVPGVGHISIEKNQIMQQKVISEIDAVVFGRSVKLQQHEAAATCSSRRGETAARPRRVVDTQLIVRRFHGSRRREERAANSANSFAIDIRKRWAGWPARRPCGPPRLYVENRKRKTHEQSDTGCSHCHLGGAFLLCPLDQLQSGVGRSGRAVPRCSGNVYRDRAPGATQPATQPRARVYLFRGALGPIFSRGMDRLTERLEEAGIRADVYEFTICRLIADQAIRDFRDDPAPITLIGHSMGGLCALTFAGILQSENIPVSLVVTIDPAHASPKVPLNVERYINIFLSTSILGGGDVVTEQGYQGHYASFNLKEHQEVTHINIDKMDSIHEQLVTAIAQLATTPAQTNGEAAPFAMSFPPTLQLSCGTAARRNSPVRAIRCRGLRRLTMCRSGHSPRPISCRIIHCWQLASASLFRAASCHLSRRPRRRAETISCGGPAASAGRKERNQHRNATAIRSVCVCAEFSREEAFLHAGLLPHQNPTDDPQDPDDGEQLGGAGGGPATPAKANLAQDRSAYLGPY